MTGSWWTNALLALQEASQQAPAQGQPGNQQGPNPLLNMVPILLIFVIVWFLMIRPQRRQEKERQAMLAAVKENDHVRTLGGLRGVVHKIKDDEVILTVDERSGTRIRFDRSAIVSVEKPSGPKGDAPKEPAEAAGK